MLSLEHISLLTNDLSKACKEILKLGRFQTLLFHGVPGTKCRELGNTMSGERTRT